jgi:hypothetical protein
MAMSLDLRISRRKLFQLGLGAAAAVSVPTWAYAETHPLYGGEVFIRDELLYPPPESVEDFPVLPIDKSNIPTRFHRQQVDYAGQELPGTIIVDPANRLLYFILPGNQAVRYGVGVGRAGFAWSGNAHIGMKRSIAMLTPLNGSTACQVVLVIRWVRAPCISMLMAKTRCSASTAPTIPHPLAKPCLPDASACSMKMWRTCSNASTSAPTLSFCQPAFDHLKLKSLKTCSQIPPVAHATKGQIQNHLGYS